MKLNLYNRVNSKATLKVPLVALLPLVPRILHGEIQSCRFIAKRSQSLVIQSDASRRQSENLELCFEKLQDLLLAAGKAVVQGETSLEQKIKVRNLCVALNLTFDFAYPAELLMHR